ncbi:MAG: class I SAM-dependent methyltransferase [Conexibacter sp.]
MTTAETTPDHRAGDGSARSERWPSGQRTGLRAAVLRRSLTLLEHTAARLGRTLVVLEYPPTAELAPRWGHGRPPHTALAALIEAGRERCAAHLAAMGSALGEMRVAMTAAEARPGEPYWENLWMGGMDAASLSYFLAARNPARYVEIGSGMSTRWARHAIRTHGLRTEIVSIDPMPRTEIAGLCDVQLRRPLEQADLSIFAELEAGDVVLMDGSHRAFQNSDATVFVLDVLPQLASGVLVGIHDVTLPHDYPPAWRSRFYSEQYLLAAYLLGGAGVQIELPCYFAETDPHLGGLWRRAWTAAGLEPIDSGGQAFWMHKR